MNKTTQFASYLLALACCVALTVRAADDDNQTVTAHEGTVHYNHAIDNTNQAPDNSVVLISQTQDNGDVLITTKIFHPPTDEKTGKQWTFVQMPGPNKIPYWVDVQRDGEKGEPVVIGTPTAIYITVTYPTSVIRDKNASAYPLVFEGLVQPPPGAGGNSKPHYYMVQVAAPPDIQMDVNRDGDVTDADSANETTIGVIVIADKDDAYLDPDDPARRRKVLLTNASGGKVRVRRDSDDIELHMNQAYPESPIQAKLDPDLFQGANEVAIDPGTYWMDALEPSVKVRDHYIGVLTRDEPGAPIADKVCITVLWVQINGNTTKRSQPAPVNNAHQAWLDDDGDDLMGVREDTPDSSNGEGYIGGRIEILGQISPPDLKEFDPASKMTVNFHEDKDDLEAASTADFGFLFRRHIDYKDYSNGLTPADAKTRLDDSTARWQDDDPDAAKQILYIADNDSPEASLDDGVFFFPHAKQF
ncbi:MAG: hypothetical protein ACREP2_13275 [Rhodanobacteraceae bacterium]